MANRFVQEDMQDAHALQEQMLRMTLSEVNVYYEDNLRNYGTNVDQNKADPQGDGDQSPVNAQFYRDIFAVGGDINHLADLGMEPLSDFAKYCVSGEVTQVKRALERVAGREQAKTAMPSAALIQLLETRETAMRLSPLLMIVSMGKNLAMPGRRDLQIQAAELLLQYGARPDARDVCGKTVCHYGMGAMATEMTLEVVDRCIEAHDSSHLFGKKVELHSLKVAAMNGMQGICKGYANGRRVVYLLESKKTVSIKPQNLKFEDASEAETPTKLCDVPDRLGAVCLLEVLTSGRTDVAKILLEKHHANLEIQDCDGCSALSMSVGAGAGLMSKVAHMINKEARKKTQRKNEKNVRTCSNCGKFESDILKLLECARCLKVRYCGKKCQVDHWKQGGHKKECKKLAEKQAVSIMLERPTGNMFFSTISMQSSKRSKDVRGQKEGDGYRKPRNVGIGEKFDVKVQGGGPMTPLMIYDKSRECNLTVSPGSRGFDELLSAVKAEPTWQGRKTFVSASFDKDGNCIVYPGITSIHKW